jgi:hypothetical protein
MKIVAVVMPLEMDMQYEISHCILIRLERLLSELSYRGILGKGVVGQRSIFL